MFSSTKKFHELDCKQAAVRAIRFNVDGQYCMTCGSDKSIKLWNPYRTSTVTPLQTYYGHGYEVLDVASSCDSANLASGGMDKHVFYWDVATAQIVRKFQGHIAQINAVKFNEESTVILSASLDNSIRAWDCRSRTKEPIQIMKEAKDSVTSIQVSNYEIISASLDGHVRRYDLRKGELCCDNIGVCLGNVCFTRDGQCILISCLDSTLKLLDKDTGQLLAEYQGHKNTEYRTDSCLNNSDTHVISGSEDGKVYVWELVEGSLKHQLVHEGHRVVHSLAHHPSKPVLLTATEGIICLWTEPSFSSPDTGEDS